METLNRTKHELLEGKAKIADIINKLEKEEVCFDHNSLCLHWMAFIRLFV